MRKLQHIKQLAYLAGSMLILLAACNKGSEEVAPNTNIQHTNLHAKQTQPFILSQANLDSAKAINPFFQLNQVQADHQLLFKIIQMFLPASPFTVDQFAVADNFQEGKMQNYVLALGLVDNISSPTVNSGLTLKFSTNMSQGMGKVTLGDFTYTDVLTGKVIQGKADNNVVQIEQEGRPIFQVTIKNQRLETLTLTNNTDAVIMSIGGIYKKISN